MNRWIAFDGIVNARDLGGIPGADGKRVKPGRLLRGAGLSQASDADLLRLERDYHLRHIVDFRFEDERGHNPDRMVPGAAYHSLPALARSGGERTSMFDAAEPDFDAIYQMVYTRLAEQPHTARTYRQLFEILLSRPDGAVYYHCTQGKDRTGMATVLILTALGADWTDIEADYFLSNVGLDCMVDRISDPRSANWSRFTREHRTYVYPANLATYAAVLRRDWGGTENYLRQCVGLTEAEIAALRREYLE